MNKRQFIKLAYEIGYCCQYSGHSKTFYLRLIDEADVSGDMEFINGIHSELESHDFRVVYL